MDKDLKSELLELPYFQKIQNLPGKIFSKINLKKEVYDAQDIDIDTHREN